MLQQKRNDITPVQSRSAMIASAAAGAATAAEPCVRPGPARLPATRLLLTDPRVTASVLLLHLAQACEAEARCV
jgi:hypothetical protein